jgi:hypothetical protein
MSSHKIAWHRDRLAIKERLKEQALAEYRKWYNRHRELAKECEEYAGQIAEAERRGLTSFDRRLLR